MINFSENICDKVFNKIMFKGIAVKYKIKVLHLLAGKPLLVSNFKFFKIKTEY